MLGVGAELIGEGSTKRTFGDESRIGCEGLRCESFGAKFARGDGEFERCTVRSRLSTEVMVATEKGQVL